MMSAEVYQKLLRKRNEKTLSYINNRARGIRNFLQNRSESITLDRMIYEVNLMKHEIEHIKRSNYP